MCQAPVIRSAPNTHIVRARGLALGSCEIDDQSPSAANLKEPLPKRCVQKLQWLKRKDLKGRNDRTLHSALSGLSFWILPDSLIHVLAAKLMERGANPQTSTSMIIRQSSAWPLTMPLRNRSYDSWPRRGSDSRCKLNCKSQRYNR